MGILTGAFEKRFHPSQEPPTWWNSLSGWQTASGVTVTPQTSLQCMAVYACVRVLAETIASLPLNVYRRLDNHGKEKVPNHYLYPILHDLPNPEMTSFELRETLMGHLGTWGNAYAEIEINGSGQCIELWPLRPDRMRVRRRNGQLEYVYRLPNKLGATEVVLPNDRIQHLRGFGADGLIGYSPVAMARQAVGLAMATEEFGARFFGNDARPGAVLEHPGKLSKEAQDRLKASWDVQHRGLEKSHRMAILEEGLTLKEVGLPPQDAQFLETRKFQVAEIARLYRVPPHMIADLERSTFSNIEHQSIDFVVHTIRPWLVRWEQSIKKDIFLPGERKYYFAEFMVDGLLRGDIKSRYEAYSVGRQNGWLSANDVRQMENMNPIDGGDVYLIPLNMIPANQAGDLAAGSDEENNRIQSNLAEIRAVRTATSRHRLAEASRRIFLDAGKRIMRREINDLRRGAKKIFKNRNYGEFSLWLDEFYEDHRSFIQRQMLPVLMTYAELVVDEAKNEIGVDTDLGPEMEDFVRSYGEAYANRHVGTSIGQLRDVAKSAVDAGEDPVQALDVRFDAWEESRPARIAQRESYQSNNAIAKFVYLAAGILFIRWNAFGESCPYCTDLNGRIIGIQKNFISAGEEFQPDGADAPLTPTRNVGHPPAHAGCDCMITAAA